MPLVTYFGVILQVYMFDLKAMRVGSNRGPESFNIESVLAS